VAARLLFYAGNTAAQSVDSEKEHAALELGGAASRDITNGASFGFKSGARLVILDHASRFVSSASRQNEAAHHEITRAEVEDELLGSGFEILKCDDCFVDQTDQEHVSWLITARNEFGGAFLYC
jgi:choline dehydrogenase-like flavoprotein